MTLLVKVLGPQIQTVWDWGDSSMDSASSDSVSSSSALSEERDDSDHPSTSRDGGYVRFEVQDDSNRKRPLPEDMSAYLTKTFTSFIPDKLLKENILDKYPVPSTSAVQAPKLDNYVPEIFNTTKSSYGKSYDTNLHQIQSRIGAVMGPISKIWVDLDNIRMGRSTGEDLDLVDWLNVVEKSITLLGQAFSTTTYHRRMNVLYNLTKDVKEAKNLLKTNSEGLSKGDNLFGKRFYKALSKASKIRKKSKEISRLWALQKERGASKVRLKLRGPRVTTGPISQGPHLVRLEVVPASPSNQEEVPQDLTGKPTFSFSKPRSNKKSIIPCQPGYRGKQGCIGVSKNGAKHKFASRSSKRTALGTSPDGLSGRRKALPFFGQLEVANTGQLHPTDSAGSGNSSLGNTDANIIPLPQTKPKELHFNRSGGPNDDHQRSRQTCFSLSRSISEPCLSSPKEGRRAATSNQSEEAESVCRVPAFQVGRHSSLEIPGKEGRFHGETGPQRCLFWGANSKIASQIPPVCLERENLRVPGPTLRSRGRALLLHQTLEARYCISQENRCKNYNLLGQHDFAKPEQSYVIAGLDLAEVALRKSWVHHKLEKVSLGSHTGNSVSGLPDRLGEYGHSTPTREDSEDHSEVPTPCLKENNTSLKDLRNFRTDDIIITGYSPGTATLSPFTNDPHSRAPGKQIISGKSGTKYRVLTGTEMVDFPDAELEWEINYLSRARFDLDKRCLQKGVGRDPGVKAGSGLVDSRGDQPTYQCAGIERGPVCTENVCPGSAESACPDEIRQQDCSRIYQKKGRNTFRTHAPCYTGDMEVRSRQGDSPVRRVPARLSEFRSGLAVEKLPRQQRLAAEEMLVPTAEQSAGAVQAGPVCESAQHTARTLCQLVPGSICPGSGRFSATMDGRGALSVSPLCHDFEVSNEDATRQNISGSDSTSLANSALVPKPSVYVGGQPDPVAPIQGHTVIPERPGASTSAPKLISTCGFEDLRKRDLDQGISEQAAKLPATHSCRKGTTTAYNSSWRQWCSWCNGRQVDPLRAPVVDMVNYLSERFDKGDSYRTLNSRRSAISAFHVPVDGTKVGQHPLGKRFLTATFNARPPQPRYTVQWDVNVVLTYIKSLGTNDKLPDKFLTLKLAMLLALVSAGRTSELCTFDIRYLRDSEDSITFQLSKLTKSRKTGQAPLSLTFSIFTAEPALCVVQTTRDYLARSSPWRSRSEVERNQLLLSYVEPHKPVVSCTIAGWLVRLLKEAGIDTDEFRAHSTRGASTSKAQAMGLSCSEILEAARWSKMTTFKRHYLREVPKPSVKNAFQTTVLS